MILFGLFSPSEYLILTCVEVAHMSGSVKLCPSFDPFNMEHPIVVAVFFKYSYVGSSVDEGRDTIFVNLNFHEE